MIAGSTSWASSSELAPSCPILANADAHCLVAAAYLHDIGWAPELVDTGFHPIGRARWVQRHGFERLARLVAHHSAARFEAELRGLAPLLAAFELEESPTADALAYCDLTTSPTGDIVTPVERWTDIIERYGRDDIVVQALVGARPLLEDPAAPTVNSLGARRYCVTTDASRLPDPSKSPAFELSTASWSSRSLLSRN